MHNSTDFSRKRTQVIRGRTGLLAYIFNIHIHSNVIITLNPDHMEMTGLPTLCVIHIHPAGYMVKNSRNGKDLLVCSHFRTTPWSTFSSALSSLMVKASSKGIWETTCCLMNICLSMNSFKHPFLYQYPSRAYLPLLSVLESGGH